MTQVRLDLDDYTLRVLDVVKGKYGLKNRNEALKQFAQEYGNELVEIPVNETYLKELDEKLKTHIKENKFKAMKVEELNKVLGLDKNNV